MCKRLPLSSRQASLHPVLNAGSNPRTRYPVIGLVISRFSRFDLNTSMALSSAFSVSSALISRSIDGRISLFRASFKDNTTYSFTNDEGFLLFFLLVYLLCNLGHNLILH